MPLPQLRTRGSNDISSIFGGLWEGDGYSHLYEVDNWRSFRSYNYITDVIGNPKSVRVKPVDHVQAEYTGLPYQPFVQDYHKWYIPQGRSLPMIDIEQLLAMDEFTLPHSQRVQAAGEALIFFAERFPSKVSGAEFIQGLFELKALLPKLKDTMERTLASSYLTDKFGWENLMSDLDQFSRLVGSVRSRMEFLKKTYGKPTKLFFRKPDLQVFLPGWTHSNFWGASTTYGTRMTLKSYECYFTAGCTLVQYMKHIDDAIGWMRAIVISLGFNNLATSAWKTTRLSFVVDWFFDVSGHLNRLATIQPADAWDVYHVSCSMVLNATLSVDQVNIGMIETPDNIQRLGTLSIKRYTRWIGLPLDLTVFTPSSTTPDQLVLLLAMAASK